MSSSDTAIRITNLSKCYHIYEKPRDRLFQMLARQRKRFYREFWALKDVSLEVKKGETVGIIGRNGSGKSTLLQLICGTLNPTSGVIETHGKIAALLELGSGFNPQFTGRENIYLNGSVLGLSQEEIKTRFDAIAAFAEIGSFIEQPVKTYSSGMLVRLAFAVAIHVEPEILIVDEALSVGDELFRRKCFSRIESIRASGATILFVSHSGGIIVNLCNRAVLLDAGEKLAVGEPKRIVGVYQKMLYAPAEKRSAIREEIRALENHLAQSTGNINFANEQSSRRTQDSRPQIHLESFAPNLKSSSTIEYESKGVKIESPMLQTLGGERVNTLVRGRSYVYRYTVKFQQNARNVRFGMLIKTTNGLELGGSTTAKELKDCLAYVEANTTYRITFKFQCSLNHGVYFLNSGVLGEIDGIETYLHRLIDALAFKVLPDKDNLTTGVIDFGCRPEIQLQQST
ncbi:ABC transporter ATP-binding protein [candidate division KSB1 bacterium]|nr:ABC transporter ATP-binding protein [candidate division KSB1 bacterium]